MGKAILELSEMPESCRECMFKECLNRTTSVEVSRCIILHKMHVPGGYCPAEGRQADCPLKPVDTDMLEKQKPKKVIETPDKHKYGYCPICGRIYWDKCHVGNYCDSCGQRLEVERNG